MNSIPKSNRAKPFTILVIEWIFLTILPQAVGITRNDDSPNSLKVVLFLLIIYSILIFIARREEIYIDRYNMVVGGLYILSVLKDPGRDIIISIIYISIFYILFSKCKIDRNGILLICDIYELFILYACIYNLILNWRNLAGFAFAYSGYQYNFASFFSSRNTFGIFLLLAVYLGAIKSVMTGKCNILYGIIIIINLILSLSRGSIFSVILFVVILVLLEWRRLGRRTQLILFIGGVLGLYAIFCGGYKDFIINIILRPEAGSSGRLEKWKQLLRTIDMSNILFGQGMPAVLREINTHNTILAIMIGSGLYGFIIYLLMYAKTIINIFRIRKLDQRVANVFLAIVISFLIIEAMVESNLLWQSDAKSVWVTFVTLLLPNYYYSSLEYLRAPEE